jgi:hypothetical protein
MSDAGAVISETTTTAVNNATPTGVTVGEEAKHEDKKTEEHHAPTVHEHVTRAEHDELRDQVKTHGETLQELGGKLEHLTTTATEHTGDAGEALGGDSTPRGVPWTHYRPKGKAI